MQVKGIRQLLNSIDSLKEQAEEVRQALEDKQQWLENKSDRYQESEAGLAWEEYLNDVEALLEQIDSLEVPETD